MGLVGLQQVRVQLAIPHVRCCTVLLHALATSTIKLLDDILNERQIQRTDLVLDVLCLVGLDAVGVEVGRTVLVDVVLAVELVAALLLGAGGSGGGGEVQRAEFWTDRWV